MEMIQLTCENDILFIFINDHLELTTGRYEIILRSAGFHYDPQSKVFWMQEMLKNRKKVNDTINFLRKKKIPLNITEDILNLKDDYEQEKSNYSKYRHLGTQVKQDVFDLVRKPPNFVRILKPYQIMSVNHLVAVNNGANFSVPGSGKTTMVYGSYDIWKDLGEIDAILIIGPINSFYVWESEYEKCFGRSPFSARLIGNGRFGYYINYERFELFLTSYQTASNDLSRIIELLGKKKFLVVIDESHNVKRFNDGLWSESMLSLASYAEKRVICTGTPVPNGLIDLYTQMTFLWPNKQLLGEKNTFYYRYRNPENLAQLRDLIYPFYVRVRKSDLQLPEPIEHRIYIEGSPIQMEIYRAIEEEILNKYSSLSSHEILTIQEWKRAKIIRLMQVATNPGLLTHYSEEFGLNPIIDGELMNLVEKVDQYYDLEFPNKFGQVLLLANRLLNEGKKVIIWSNFIQNLLILYSHFEQNDIDRFMIYGGVPRDPNINDDFNREQQIREFKNNLNPCVLIANPAACAESISLHQDCHDSIYLDRTFNCAKFLQSLDRIHRIGLDPNVETNYYFFMTKNTIDEVIDNRLETKKLRMMNLIESDIPIGLDYEFDDWDKQREFDKDFKGVIKQIKIRYQNRREESNEEIL